MNNNFVPEIGGVYKFASCGVQVVLSEPMKTSGGVMCVKTAQIFMDFDGEKRILLNSDGTVFHYPATAHPDIGSITKHLELAAESHESKGWTWKHFNEVVLRVPAKKKKRKKK